MSRTNQRTEAKSTVTRRTARTLDVRPFAKIIMPNGEIKYVGNEPNDINPTANTVVVMNRDGSGRQTINLASGKYYIQDSLEDQAVDKLLETDPELNEQFPMGPSPEANRRPGTLRRRRRWGPMGMGPPGRGLGMGRFQEDSDDDETSMEDEPVEDEPVEDEPVEEPVEGPTAEESPAEDVGADIEAAADQALSDLEDTEPEWAEQGELEPEEAAEAEEADRMELVKDFAATVPEEEQELVADIQNAIDQLMDFEIEKHSAEGGEGAEEAAEAKAAEEALRRDIKQFLDEQDMKPTQTVKDPSVTNPQASSVSQVGQPTNPGEEGGTGEGESKEEKSPSQLTNPSASSPAGGKPKDEIEGHPEEVTKREGSATDETTDKGVGPAPAAGLTGEKVREDIRRDLERAVKLIERGANPHKLAARVLCGSR